MATYQIWSNISEVAPGKYMVMVSAVPKAERTQERTGGVKTAEAKTLEEAEALREQMVLEAGKRLRDRGHVILDHIDDTNKG
jgi:hypothetical protein